MTVAVIFVPPGEFDPHATRCVEYCQRRRYEIAGIVRGDWDAVMKMMCDRSVTVVVMSTSRHLDPQRCPRIETITQEVTGPHTPRNQRTRLIRRDAAT